MSGLPLLSGSPPAQSEDSTENEVACRKCNKEFNFLFTRSRKCHHCGYMYCHNCTDYQALMPRAGGQGDSGYDLVNVCAFCIEYLQITAAGRGQLKSMPLSKLKKYAGAYNIQISRAVEKDDIINALLSARRPNGCLPGVNEAYYRRYSVPNRSGSRPRGLFSSRPEPAPNPPPRPPTGSVNASQREFARPDLTPDLTPDPEPRPAPNYQTRPPNSPPSNYDAHSHSHPPYTPNPLPSPPRNTRNNSYNPHYTQYPQQQQQQPPPPPPQHSYPQYVPRARPPPPPSSSRPAPAPAPAARSVPPPPPPPPPSLDELLNMSPQSISTLPISSLKQILFQNHVNTSATTILEKSDLVKRVVELVEVEKREREEKEEREREEREEEEMAIREAREAREFERRQREREEAAARATPNRSTNPEHRARVDDASDDDDSIHHPPPSSSSTPPQEEINILPPQSPSPRPPSEDYPMAPTPPPATATPSSSPPPSSSLPKPQTKPHERHTGLCVICQDEDANIAIVDCG
ncbi:hypothetical protein V5O48_009687 [Marasmius crinis-equi]|uniref:FYVE-type domain-containing protein n=1 Tax=Marasmius crinis-equi TaxID=585013 RepID=A0ABR3FAI5_9AGAR